MKITKEQGAELLTASQGMIASYYIFPFFLPLTCSLRITTAFFLACCKTMICLEEDSEII